MRLHRSRSTVRLVTLVAAIALIAPACGDDDATTAAGDERCEPTVTTEAISSEQVAGADVRGTTVTLVTHDSFAVSDDVFDEFEEETGITVRLLSSGDTGQLVSQAVLTAGRPVGDVLFGIDNTFLCRGINGNVFAPYESPALADVPNDLQIDPTNHVTPIDVGDVCLNYSKSAFAESEPPRDLDDLVEPEYRGAFVTQNPETSSPGFAFLLATIAKYGEDGWEDYWRQLRANGVQVTSGWTAAYTEAFRGGRGDRSIVTSYATSPVAEVVYAEPSIDTPPTGVVTDSCFRQIEFAGILRGTAHPEAAAKLVDFLLSPRFQEDIPLNMFVEPVNENAQLPEVFEEHRTRIDAPLTLDSAVIEANRAAWTDRWTQIVLR
jgi:thiamine transport system substrate-binding protein